MAQQYIQERNAYDFEIKLASLLERGGKVITTGVQLEKAEYWYNGPTCKRIEYTNVYWAVVDLSCTKEG